MYAAKRSIITTIADAAKHQDNCLVLTTALGFIMGDLVTEEAERAIIPGWSGYLEESQKQDVCQYIVLRDVRVRVGNDAAKPDFELSFMVVFLSDILGVSIGKKR